MNHHGGFISSSHVNNIIRELSEKYEQTAEIKKRVNNSTISNSGHGSIFLGTSGNYDGGDRNVRMLIGAHFARNELGIFGGRCKLDETTLDTVIRETIEEIFNFEPIPIMIEEIRNFLNRNTQLYFIFQISEYHKAYSYVFDVSILGDFIRIISSMGIYNIPREIVNGIIADRNIAEYYVHNKEFTDLSSFNGNYPFNSIGSTISLSEFLKDRYISRERALLSRQAGLNEIKYLSFASLDKLVSAAGTTGIYKVYNFVNDKREKLVIQAFLKNLLLTDIIQDILKYSINN
jgi:hypothetical protein